MEKGNYYLILFLTLVNFLALIGMLSGVAVGTFLAEIFIGLAFIILAAITLYLITAKADLAWPFSIFFFSLNLMNAVYMFFFTRSTLLVIYAVSSVIGFIISVYNVDTKVRKSLGKAAKKKKPKIIVQNVKPRKKAAGKKPKKKAVKKKSRKKTAKKKKSKKKR